MYVPQKWQFPSEQAINEFVARYSFATLVSPSLQATRLPLLFDAENHCLIGHFSRANPHWKEVTANKCLAIFDGPHDYISPTWYAQAPNVPTWNYASVHVKGQVTLLDSEQTHLALNKLLAKYEPELLREREIVTQDYQQKLSKGIVGFSMTIEQVDAKAKLGQHRTEADQQGVAIGLKQSKSLDAQALLALMEQWQLGLG